MRQYRSLQCEMLEDRILLASDLPFSPVLDLDVTDGVVADSVTGAVSQWQDQSGQGNDLRSSGSEQPTLGGAQTPSGLDAIRFDGIDDRLLRGVTDPGGINGLPVNNTSRTVFLVAQFHDATGFGGVGYGRGTINQAFGVGVSGNHEGNVTVQGWGNGNDFVTSEKVFDPPGTTTGWTVLSVVHTKDNGNPADNLSVYQDGTLIATYNHDFNTKLISTANLNGNTAARMVIGQELKELGNIQLDVAAWAVYDKALSNADRQVVEMQLTGKYLAGGTNQAPAAVDDFASITAGGSTVIDILSNDTDADGTIDPTSVVIVDPPVQAASISVNPSTGMVSYSHNGSPFNDSFTYTVRDNSGAISNTATVAIVVESNLPPVAVNDAVTIDDGASVIIDLLANDSDPNGTLNPNRVTIVNFPQHASGLLLNLLTGQVTYTHDASGLTDSFTYTVQDDQGEVSNVATVAINLSSINQAPIAVDDSYVINDGAATTFNILGNDSDADGTIDPTSVVIVNPPQHDASFSVNPTTGVVSYTHDGNGSGDSFTYTVLDNQGLVSNVATVNLSLDQQPLSLAGFTTELVTPTGLDQPISLDFLPDGRMLILLKGGQILIADPNTGARTTYMTLTNIDSGGEKGLLDISISPDFDPNAPGDDYFYLYYTPASPQRARVARFTHQQNSGGLTSRGNVNSEMVVWQDTDAYISCCHYGGILDHGPDGKLWFTASDKFTAPNPGEGGTNENLPQNLTKAGGKVLRVNPDGSIPDGTDGWPANPFIDPVDDDPNIPGNQDYLDSIWAYGLRNPFRGSWDIPSGRFIFGEVGGNVQNLSEEDIHVATLDKPGVNFGWPYYEGSEANQVLDPNGPYAPTHGFTPIVPDAAIFSYPHDGAGASVTGGAVYRGTEFPAEWDGVYFYGDFTRDYIRYLTFDTAGNVTGDFPFLPSTQIPVNANQLVHLSVGPDGALYYLLLDGRVRRVVHNGGNQAPVIQQINASINSGTAPLMVDFTAQVTDANNDAMTYTWYFGDGNSTTGTVVNGVANASHTYSNDGLFQAFLEVSDPTHTINSQFLPIQVGTANTPPTITQPTATPESGVPPLQVTFTAQASDADNDPLTYEIFFGNGVTSGTKAVPANGQISEVYNYVTGGSFNAFLVVSDGIDSAQSPSFQITVGATQVPPITAGLVLLLESDIKVGVSSATTVASWLDGSGSGNNLDAFGDPQIVPNATPGGQPALVLDGNGDKLQRSQTDTINNFPENGEDRTVFTVVKYVDNQSSDSGFVFGKGNANRAFGLVSDRGTGNLSIISGVDFNDLESTTPGDGAGWLTHSAIVSSNVVTEYADGVSIGSMTHTYQTRMNLPESILLIGQDIRTLGYSQLEVGAILVYDRALNESERQQVENYLHSKYFVGNLPPVAVDDSGLVAPGAAAVIDVLANDSDADGVLNPSTVTIVDPPLHGTATVDPTTGAVTYQHDDGASVSDTFTYTVNDEVHVTSGIATVAITVGNGSLVSSGLVVALESDAGVATDGGSNVLGWLDSSGSGNDLQTVIDDPTITAAATPAGADAIHFDGNDGLARLGAIDPLNNLPTGASDRSIFVVARYNTTSAYAGVTYGTSAANEAFGVVATAPGGKLAVQGVGAANDVVSTNQGTGSGWLLQGAVLESNQLEHYRDGKLIDAAFHAYNTDDNDLRIAEAIDGTGFADMDVAAVLIYDRALSEMEQHEVQAYLHSKYL